MIVAKAAHSLEMAALLTHCTDTRLQSSMLDPPTPGPALRIMPFGKGAGPTHHTGGYTK